MVSVGEAVFGADSDFSADVVIVGGGAAGLAAAIFAARRNPRASIAVLEGAKKPGAKILVSGGGRCNVTNATVTDADFWGGSRNVIRRILRAFPADRAVEFFRHLGVDLHEEEHGKLFPNTNSARTVLDALLAEAARLNVNVFSGHRVVSIEKSGETFYLNVESRLTPASTLPGVQGPADATGAAHLVGPLRATRVVMATGGQSLPKTGSDGFGYTLARHLGHSIVPTCPALAPLILDGEFHKTLSGVSHEVELTLRSTVPDPVSTHKPVRLRGDLLWTHFGVSGPVAMNMSRLWHRARLAGNEPRLSVNLLGCAYREEAEKALIELAANQPRTYLHNALATRLPNRVAQAVLQNLDIDAAIPMSQFSRAHRVRLLDALLDWPLPVRDSRGFAYAEATAGGVPLDEIDPITLASRKTPGLFLVGEILDVDGRIGGYNFQWAWSSAYVAGNAIGVRAET